MRRATSGTRKRSCRRSVFMVPPDSGEKASAVHQFGPAVLAPGVFRVGLGRRLLLAETDRLDLGVAHAEQVQGLLHCFRALLAQREVVLAAAAFVGVAADGDLPLGMM